MRGRPPKALTIRPDDLAELERIAHSDTAPKFQVQRARMVLGIAEGQQRQHLATLLGCDESTILRACDRYRDQGIGGALADCRYRREVGFSARQRVAIVELACLEPVASGLHITHLPIEELTRQAVSEGIVNRITSRTVRSILQDVKRQPHRIRYCDPAYLGGAFAQQAEQVLLCYAQAARLAEQGVWVVCADRVPLFPALECPPGRQAFRSRGKRPAGRAYRRGKPVHLLVFLVVHTGRLEAVCLGENSQEQYLTALERFRSEHAQLRGVFLIQDGKHRHRAAASHRYFAGSRGWWQHCYAPEMAPWFNLAEHHLHALKHRAFGRACWENVEVFQAHVLSAVEEHNRRHAQAIAWHWTLPRMRRWLATHSR
jgi:hypothetical protein